MVGLNIIITFLAKSCFMSILANHRCCFTSSTPFFSIPNLFDTSATKRCLINDFASLKMKNFLLIHVLGKAHFSFKNILINDHGIIICEGIYASIHLIDENTQCPPIYSLSMTLIQNNLRC